MILSGHFFEQPDSASGLLETLLVGTESVSQLQLGHGV